MKTKDLVGLVLVWKLVAANIGRARENCNSNDEDHSRMESVPPRRDLVRGADLLLAQLW